jgi:GNAT superfamily N-acetyltransferase
VTIGQAIDTFVLGFTFTRSYTHPYLAEQIEGIWVMRDAERRSGDYRNEEWVAHGIAPATLEAVARTDTRGRYVINVIRTMDEPDESIRADFKALGYRLTRTEAFMIHELTKIEPFDGPLPISRVRSQEGADLLAKETRRKQILPQHLLEEPPSIRQYVAMDGDNAAGWAASIAAGEATWCSNVFVKPEYRRKGIARALLSRILLDDRAAGSSASVLLASHAGAKLYPMVGYRQIGELMMFVPRRR